MKTPLLLCSALLLSGCASWFGSSTAPVPVAAAPVADPAMMGAQAQADLYLGVVDGLIRQERYQAAIAFLAKYQKTGAQTPRFRKLTADALNGAGRYDEAIASYRSLMNTQYAPDAYAGIARADSARGDWAGAADNFRQAAVLDPANAGYLNNLGFASLQQKLTGADLAPAVDALERAHELEPESNLIRNNLALAEARAGQHAQLVALLDAIPDDGHRKLVSDFTVKWNAGPQRVADNSPAKENTP